MGTCCTLAKNKIFLEDKDLLFLFYLYSTVEGTYEVSNTHPTD